MAGAEWLSEFRMLAERKAVLRGAFGSYYDAPGEPFLGQLWLTALQEAGVITWKVSDKPSHRRPVGLRLQFWKADLWILNVGDEIELFDRRPPYWREYELSE
jgi:hypothetical protein